MKRDPQARRLLAHDAAMFARSGEHCGARWCRQPVAIVIWWSSAPRGRHGRPKVTEQVVCERHGQRFARRHTLEIR